MSEQRFSEKSLVMVGGAGGLGKACVLRALNEGARVAVLDMQVVEDLIPADHPAIAENRLTQIPVDITNKASVQSAVAQVLDWTSQVHGLVVMAAKISGANALDCQVDDWNLLHAVNNTGAFLCMQALLPHFIEKGHGNIVTISSVSAVVAGIGNDIAYKSSKAALLQTTRSIAVDYAAQGIRANCIMPGAIATAFGRDGRVAKSDELGTKSAKKPPLGRRAEPAEIASAVLYLLSDDSSYITGVSLPVDGGFLAI